MRPSPLRHTLAILRTTLGLTQKEMAIVAECSTPTIQAIELGKLKLSDALGVRLMLKTGADARWLLANDASKPPIDPNGKPFTKKSYQEWQSKHFGLPQSQEEADRELQLVRRIFISNIQRLMLLSVHNYINNQVLLGSYKTMRGLSIAARELGLDLKDKRIKDVWENTEDQSHKKEDDAQEFVSLIVKAFLEETAAVSKERIQKAVAPPKNSKPSPLKSTQLRETVRAKKKK